MKKKRAPTSLPYFFGSVALIVTAVIATAIVNRTSNTAGGQDIRTRASVTSLMRMTAVVTSVGESNNTLVVNGLQFSGSAPEGMARNTAGEWTVTVAGTAGLAGLYPGARVELQVDPSTFNITQQTLTAAAITVSR